MLYAIRVPRIVEAGPHTFQQTDLAIHRSQQQRATVAGRPGSIKSRHHLSRKMRFKRESCLVTLCHGKGRLSFGINFASTTQLCLRKRPFSTCKLVQLLIFGEKSRLAPLRNDVASIGPAWLPLALVLGAIGLVAYVDHLVLSTSL